MYANFGVKRPSVGNHERMRPPSQVLSDAEKSARRAGEHLGRLVEKELDEYSHGDDRPLRSYAAFITTYVTAVAGTVYIGRRRGVRLPDRISAGDFLLLASATHRLSRLVSKDSVTAVVRAPFTRYVEPTAAGEVHEEVRGQGLRHAVGELLGCPFCLGQWIGTAFVGGFVVAPRATRVVATAFAVVSVSDAFQFAYGLLEKTDQ